MAAARSNIASFILPLSACGCNVEDHVVAASDPPLQNHDSAMCSAAECYDVFALTQRQNSSEVSVSPISAGCFTISSAVWGIETSNDSTSQR